MQQDLKLRRYHESEPGKRSITPAAGREILLLVASLSPSNEEANLENSIKFGKILKERE